MDRILVLFKTHLDIGFTDMAETVTNRYMNEYIPNAMRVARQLRGEKERFIWTTGSWLIAKYLEVGKDKELLEEAIRQGDIRWHGLPFTTHTELMDEGLFNYGLGISGKLDARFGFRTRAAKMTDVPGHTRSVIPYMSRAGIVFLHIGVNPASTRPEVPNLFRWRADGGEELIVMYNNDYGELTEIGTSGTAVCFAHTGDNHGPQSPEQIRSVYGALREKYPQAELVAGTLEDVAQIAVEMKEELPVITEEIGDTWIFGAGSDPRKVSQYRALLRLKDKLPGEDMEKLYQNLLLVPEHTWGLDEKITLGKIRADGDVVGEHRYFRRTDFEQVRGTEKFRRMEHSWWEQRAYVNRAVEQLEGKSRLLAERAISEYQRKPTDVSGYKPRAVGELFSIGNYQLRVNGQGEIDFLKKGDRVIGDEGHPIGGFLYEVFSQEDYDRFRRQYVTSQENWALEDFGKIGVAEAVPGHLRCRPQQVKLWAGETVLVIQWQLPKEAVELYGGIELGELEVEFREDELYLDLVWFGKKASRIPEGMWLRFCPGEQICRLKKTGGWIRPREVVSGGNRRMHGVELVDFTHMTLESLDAPVISLGEPGLVDFTRELPDVSRGLYVNLYNNTWGTNFPMWYEENARFRFWLRFKEEGL